MNASELMYWYRRRGSSFGEDSPERNRPGQWSEAEKESLRQTTRQVGSPFRSLSQTKAGRRIGRFLYPSARDLSSPEDSSEEEAQAISFSLSPEATAEAMGLEGDPMNASEFAWLYRHGYLAGPMSRAVDTFGALEREVDRIDQMVDVFGGKEEHLDRLEDRLLGLEEKLEGATGKKAVRLQRKIDRTKKKILRLQEKLGIQPEEDEEEFGAYFFVPADQDETGETGVLGARRGGSFGALPLFLSEDAEEGPVELQSSTAATASRGAVWSAPAYRDPDVGPAAHSGILRGVSEFLSSRRR